MVEFSNPNFAALVRAGIDRGEPFGVVVRGTSHEVLQREHVQAGQLQAVWRFPSKVGVLKVLIDLAARRGFDVTLETRADASYVQFAPGPDFEPIVVPSITELPEWLQQFLLKHGGEKNNSGFVLTLEQAASTLAHLPEWRKLGWYPVASDGCGNYYVVVPSGAALFIESTVSLTDGAYVAASSLAKLVEFMREDIRSSMQEQVRMQRDPAIIEFSDLAPMPWSG